MSYDPDGDPRPDRGGAYDYRGHVTASYAPELDHEPDPGEIVWTWVPYEEDPEQGKDRPVVVLGMADDAPGDYAVLMVSSRDRDGERGWVGIGSGEWDREHRPSFVRLDRMLAVSTEAVRREGAALTREQYLTVLRALTDRD
ncbi:MAG: hypothetical protein QG597_1026 [Actinomycetota bacterium]|nr:hypothetical protein [Actinomycetota bacterium]